MGKADKQQAKAAINTEQDRSSKEQNAGIGDTQARVNTLTPRADNERANILSGYGGMATGGGISDADRALFDHSSGVSGGGGSGGGSSSGPGATSPGGSKSGSGPSYLDVYRSMIDPNGGFDPTRLANVTGDANKLRNSRDNYGDVNSAVTALGNTRGNYGATDKSISGLQDFAKTGGVSAQDLAEIERPLFAEFEQTGGLSEGDRSNIRARSNSGVSSLYDNLKSGLDRQSAVRGQGGPGLSESTAKLARQRSQDLGTNARNTEADIAQQVASGRMSAAQARASNELQLLPIKSNNTLQGYNSAGNLDIGKNTEIDRATEASGQLGLTREQQISDAISKAAGIDLDTQNTVSQGRLSGAQGLQTDELTRLQDATANRGISASSAASSAARDDANNRFLIQERNSNMLSGDKGLLDTYGTAPAELMANQNLLRGYRSDASSQNQGLNDQRIQAGQMPGLMDDIAKGVNIAGNVAGMAAGGMGAFGGGAASKGIGSTGQYSAATPMFRRVRF